MPRTIGTRRGSSPADRSTRRAGWRLAGCALAVATLVGTACGSNGETGTAGGTTTTTASSSGTTAPGQPSVPYPRPGWPVGNARDHGLDQAELDDLAGYFESIHSDCMAVVKDGHLIDSRYWNGTTVDTNREVWSISKSITSTLVGIAQDQGLLDIDEPASTYIEEWKGTPSADVTIRNLLSNDSGRFYSVQSDYGQLAVGAADKTGYAIGLDQQHPRGTYWEYNSSAIQTLEAVLERATGRSVEDFAQENLFAPIGMSATILDDAAGNDIVFMGTQAGCDDIARFGYLALHDGAWDGRQVVSAAWMHEATAASQDLMTGYGLLWWRNTTGRRYTLTAPTAGDEGAPSDYPDGRKRVLVDDGTLFFPEAPADLFVAAGIQDQILVVAPSEDLIIVRLGRGGGPEDFVKLIHEIFGRVTL